MAKKKQQGIVDRLLGREQEAQPKKKRAPSKKKEAAEQQFAGLHELPQRQPQRHRTEKEVLEAIEASKGNVAATARILGLRSAYRLRQRINRNPPLMRALEHAREELLGEAETALEALVKAGHWSAIKTVLVNFGGAAGWKDEQTINLNNMASVDVAIEWGDMEPEDEG